MKRIVMLIAALCLATGLFAQPVGDQEIPITTSSDEARKLFLLGRDQLENIDFSAAAKYLDRAIEKDGAFALAFLYRALAGGGAQLLKTNLEKAQSFAANVSEGERYLINYYQGVFDANGPVQKESLDKLLLLFPDDKRVKTAAGLYYQSISDFKTAIGYYTQATQIDKEYAPCYNYLGYANIAIEDYKAAEKAFKEYIRLVPYLPNPHDSYAEFLLKTGRYNESIVQYQKAYDTDNLFVSSLIGIGNNYLFKGEFERAREYYQKYFDDAPRINDKLNALRLKARSYLYENKTDKALEIFAQHRALAEKEKQYATMLNTCFAESFALTELGRPVDGLNKCRQAAGMIDKVDLSEREKENLRSAATYWFAYVYAANYMRAKAKSSFDAFNLDVQRRSNPEEKIALSSMQGFMDFQDKNYDDAIAHFPKTDVDPWCKFYEAQSYLAKGNKGAAERLFHKVANWNQESMALAVVWNRARKAVEK